ncbi:MAG: Mor transcription activator family protein [Sphingomonadales bacterium]
MSVSYEDLPELARDMADRLGLEATLALVLVFGGTYLRVPKRANPDGAIAAAVGIDAASRLSHHFGGERLEMPRAAAALTRHERASILAQVSAGAITVGGAARQLNLTTRWVRELVNRPRRDDRQQDMFESP